MLGFPDPVPLLDIHGGGTEPCVRTEGMESLDPHGGLCEPLGLAAECLAPAASMLSLLLGSCPQPWASVC